MQVKGCQNKIQENGFSHQGTETNEFSGAFGSDGFFSEALVLTLPI